MPPRLNPNSTVTFDIKPFKERASPVTLIQYLAPETRVMVFKYALCDHDACYISIEECSHTWRQKTVLWGYGEEAYKLRANSKAHRDNLVARSLDITLLRTCKSFNAEGLEALYAQYFIFRNFVAFQTLLIRLNPTMVGHLLHIEILDHGWASPRQFLPSLFIHLSPATRLRILQMPGISEIPFHRHLGPTSWGSELSDAEYDELV